MVKLTLLNIIKMKSTTFKTATSSCFLITLVTVTGKNVRRICCVKKYIYHLNENPGNNADKINGKNKQIKQINKQKFNYTILVGNFHVSKLLALLDRTTKNRHCHKLLCAYFYHFHENVSNNSVYLPIRSIVLNYIYQVSLKS